MLLFQLREPRQLFKVFHIGSLHAVRPRANRRFSDIAYSSPAADDLQHKCLVIPIFPVHHLSPQASGL